MKKFVIVTLALCAILTVDAKRNIVTAVNAPYSAATFNKSSLYTAPVSTSVITEEEPTVSTKNALVLMPAAHTKNIKIVFKSTQSGTAAIVVLDKDGKKVLNQLTKLTAGDNNITIKKFGSLSEGTYSIQMISNNDTYNSSFIVWK